MWIQEDKSIITIDSWQPWKTTTIMVAVHGNELSWVQAIGSMIETLQIATGKIYIIYANPQALAIGKRYYQENMNRCFYAHDGTWSYEHQRVKKIMPYLHETDYLLDIHNTLSKYNSIPFLITEYTDVAVYFDVERVVSWLDLIHPWSSDSYVNNLGKVGICLECGSIYDKTWVLRAKQAIKNFLQYAGNTSWSPKRYNKPKHIRFDTLYKNKTTTFVFTKKYGNFDPIRHGEIIAYDDGEPVVADKDWYILFARQPVQDGQECFCLWYVIE